MKKLLVLCLLALPTITWTDFAKNIHRYLWANYYQFDEKQVEALMCFQQVIQDQPSLFCFKGYIHYLSKIHKYADIIPLIEKLDKPFKHDADVQLAFALALKSHGNIPEAHQRFIHLAQRFKTHVEIAYHAAHTYVELKEPENAIAVIDDLLNHSPQKPNFFIFHYLKTQLYIQIQDYPNALACIQECTSLHPEFDQGWYLFGVLQEKAGKLQEAIKGYTTFLSINNNSHKELEQHLLQLMLKQQNVLKNNNSEQHSEFEKALILYKEHKFKEALKYINKYLNEHHAHYDARILKIQILINSHQIDRAMTQIVQWIHELPEKEFWYYGLHLLTYYGASLEQIIKTFDMLARVYSHHVHPIKYLADLHLKTQHVKPARHYLLKTAQYTQDKDLKVKCYYQCAQLYYQCKQIKQAKRMLAKGYACDPSFTPLLNTYAYILATEDHDLNAAQKLITMALNKEPHNPHILDTQAVIYLSAHAYQKAYDLLAPLVQLLQDDTTIQEHFKIAQRQIHLNGPEKTTNNI